MTQYTTQMDAARRGIITPQMERNSMLLMRKSFWQEEKLLRQRAWTKRLSEK